MIRTTEQVDPTVVDLVARTGNVLSEPKRFQMQTALTEALYNTVLHTVGHAVADTVRIEIEIAPNAVRVGIHDPAGAVPFDLRDHVTALEDVDPLAESGRGLGLILQCADTIAYRPAGDGFRLDLGFSRVTGAMPADTSQTTGV